MISLFFELLCLLGRFSLDLSTFALYGISGLHLSVSSLFINTINDFPKWHARQPLIVLQSKYNIILIYNLMFYPGIKIPSNSSSGIRNSGARSLIPVIRAVRPIPDPCVNQMFICRWHAGYTEDFFS